MPDEADIKPLTDALAAAQGGTGSGAELFALLYKELHRLAESQLRRSGGVTLGATTLLHEAYLSLSSRSTPFLDRPRFFGYAARVMRGLIVDYVRERRALKRGGEFHITSLDTQINDGEVVAGGDLSALNDALLELGAVEPALAELVDLKFFCGFKFEEIAEMRGVSRRTVHRDWDRARVFLRGVLHEG